MAKVWLITGASRGLGREWATAALERGDSVVATVRDTAALDDLVAVHGERVLPVQLDVTDRARCFAVAEEAVARFGRLDVVINNAGYGQFGMVEELSEAEVRAQIETNLYGALWMTQAVLPQLRRQGGGHLIQVSSIGGVTAFAGLGIYHASKWALEGFSQSLALEVAAFGIKVTLVEPGSFSTDWGDVSAKHATPLPAYDDFRAEAARIRAARKAGRGDPVATRAAILAVVDAAEPPLRIFFGAGPLAVATKEYEARLATWRQWEPVSVAAQAGPAPAG
ncbi:MAG: hypothetical protein RJA44_836 [Pseudomonadota bacterium]|jgi:NAD(P)-dependent dehydrogenase (short-subunit alcohol dehydrogenase family)